MAFLLSFFWDSTVFSKDEMKSCWHLGVLQAPFLFELFDKKCEKV
jgi:hypothetical protein